MSLLLEQGVLNHFRQSTHSVIVDPEIVGSGFDSTDAPVVCVNGVSILVLIPMSQIVATITITTITMLSTVISYFQRKILRQNVSQNYLILDFSIVSEFSKEWNNKNL